MYIDRVGIERWSAIDVFIMKYFAGLYELWLHGASYNNRMRHVLHRIRGPRVLEVSFGLGYLLSKYAASSDVTGVDYNPCCLARARARLDSLGLRATLLKADVHALPFADGSFETVVCTDAFSIYKNPQQALKECLRVLAPGGQLIVTEYDDPLDGNLFGKLYAFGVRHLNRMPRFDSKALFGGTGLPYEDHAIGAWGVFHLFVVSKSEAIAPIVYQSARVT